MTDIYDRADEAASENLCEYDCADHCGHDIYAAVSLVIEECAKVAESYYDNSAPCSAVVATQQVAAKIREMKK